MQRKKRRGLRVKPLEAPKFEEQTELSKALGETLGVVRGGGGKSEETEKEWEQSATSRRSQLSFIAS